MPCCASPHVHGGHRHKGVGINGVRHHAHFECGVVARAAGTGPEAELYRADGIEIGVHTRQHHYLIVAISASGRRVVPIQTLGTARSVVVRAASHIRIAKVCTTVVQALQAVDERRTGAASCRGRLKVLTIGQTVDIAAKRIDAS